MGMLQESPLPNLGILLLKVWASRQQVLLGFDTATTHSHHSRMPGCTMMGTLDELASQERKGALSLQ